MTGTQRGSMIGGTWLIAIGSVFGVQQALDLSWARASADFATAERRVEIRVAGGVGSVRIG